MSDWVSYLKFKLWGIVTGLKRLMRSIMIFSEQKIKAMKHFLMIDKG
jgi:hypothetical protein